MPTLQTLAAIQGSLHSLLGALQPSGFCTRCERVSRWEDRFSHYRCSNCGNDPIVDADGLSGPVSLTVAEPTQTTPLVLPSRRRWTDRFPTRRTPGEALWTVFGPRPSLSR